MKIEIAEGLQVNIIDLGDEICFICSKANLDAVYNVKTQKIIGKGSQACREFILNQSKKILENRNNNKEEK